MTKKRFQPSFSSRGHSGNRYFKTDEAEMTVLFGFHPVLEALKNPQRKHKKLLVTPNGLHRLHENGVKLEFEPEIVRPEAIDKLLSADSVHQGLYLVSYPLPSLSVKDLPDDGLVIVLDQITDPHNVGAIIRTAAAFNVTGIMCTYRHTPATTGVLAKAASGGLEHATFVTVTNLANGLLQLQERGYTIVGLDSEGNEDLNAIPLTRPLALVLGAEGKGLRQKTRDTCTTVARLDMPGVIKSLNVSNAAAIALNAAHQAHIHSKK